MSLIMVVVLSSYTTFSSVQTISNDICLGIKIGTYLAGMPRGCGGGFDKLPGY